MKKLVIILGFLSGITGILLSTTKFYTLAAIPILIAFVCGLLILYLSKSDPKKPKSIQYIFLFVIFALSSTIYKGVVSPTASKDLKKIETIDLEKVIDTKEKIEKTEPNK